MSRPAIIVALARVLNRQPTPEEYEAFRKQVLEMCPSGRMYVPDPKHADPFPLARALELRAAGLSVRQVARELRLKKSRVALELSTKSAVTLDTEPA